MIGTIIGVIVGASLFNSASEAIGESLERPCGWLQKKLENLLYFIFGPFIRWILKKIYFSRG